MKTQILQLEPHDDIISARDKMGWAKAGRILLVWPERGRILTRRLDLELLLRRSQSLGAQLALVTDDPDVRFHARQLAIPTYGSLRKAQKSHWRVPRNLRGSRLRKRIEEFRPGRTEDLKTLQQAVRSSRPASLSPVQRLIFFTLGVLAVLSIASLLVPHAEIMLVPETRMQQVSLQVQADPDLEEINLSGLVPARWVEVTVEGRLDAPASGTTTFPVEPATGRVRFTNLTDQEVEIPKGTVVLVPETGVRFAVTRAATIAAGPGASLLLPVQAITLGTAGNVESEQITAIEGVLGTRLTVTNTSPTSGGRDRTTPSPSRADQVKLKEELLDSLRETALAELQASSQPGDVLLEDSLMVVDILEEAYTPAAGEPGDRAALKLQVTYQALAAPGETLQELAHSILDATMPASFRALEDTLRIENELLPGSSADNFVWNMTASRQIRAEIPETLAVQRAVGMSRDQALQQIQASLPLEESPQIRLSPGWWPRLPVLPFRISVNVDGAGL